MFPLYILASFVKDKVTIGSWIYLWAFYSDPLIYISVFDTHTDFKELTTVKAGRLETQGRDDTETCLEGSLWETEFSFVRGKSIFFYSNDWIRPTYIMQYNPLYSRVY